VHINQPCHSNNHIGGNNDCSSVYLWVPKCKRPHEAFTLDSPVNYFVHTTPRVKKFEYRRGGDHTNYFRMHKQVDMNDCIVVDYHRGPNKKERLCERKHRQCTLRKICRTCQNEGKNDASVFQKRTVRTESIVISLLLTIYYKLNFYNYSTIYDWIEEWYSNVVWCMETST
jgi:hypothetical protein